MSNPSGSGNNAEMTAGESSVNTSTPTVEDVELQYLENEERRIRERKEAIMRAKGQQ
jgi:hypothetical protein